VGRVAGIAALLPEFGPVMAIKAGDQIDATVQVVRILECRVIVGAGSVGESGIAVRNSSKVRVLVLVVMIGLSCSVIVGRALPGAAPFRWSVAKQLLA
jgi:hypothetical protein